MQPPSYKVYIITSRYPNHKGRFVNKDNCYLIDTDNYV